MTEDRTEPVNRGGGTVAGLTALLDMDRGALLDTEAHLFDEMAGRAAGPIVLFGAGGLGRKTLAGLDGTGLEPVCFADNSEPIQGTVVDGLPVLSAQDAVGEYGAEGVFIVSIYVGHEEVAEQLRRLGARIVVPFFVLFWKYPDRYLPHYAYDLPHHVMDTAAKVRQAWELLSDQASQREYVAQVRWRLDPIGAVVPDHVDHDIYFAPDLIRLREDEVFLDCGGYDGDTMLSFLNQAGGRFRALYVFEPDPRNLAKLERALTTLPISVRTRIHVEQLALGERSGTVGLLLGGSASSVVESGDVTVRCEPLDLVLRDQMPTFLKMDIEGAEVDALLGARQLISDNRPLLAISAYHLQDHLWTIPLLIDSFVEHYCYYYRRYTRHPYDDLVLYAIPQERCIA